MIDPLRCWYRDERPGPGTHALVVGTSAYPHRPLGLADLPSSATSAVRFAHWLRDRYPGEGRRVGSIRLLVAPSGTESVTVDPEVGVHWSDRDKVQQALHEWAADCLTSPDNVAVLFVCGHGVATYDGPIVLVSDAGAVPGDTFDKAIDVAAILPGLRGDEGPDRQWYFVDACQLPSDALRQFSESIQGGVRLPHRLGRKPRHQAVYYACEPNSPAYQTPESSIFARALEDCLDLDAIDKVDTALQGWGITGQSLLTALGHRIRAVAAEYGKQQYAAVGGHMSADVTLLECGPPMVPITLRVKPGEAELADGCGAEICDDDGGQVLQRRTLPVVDVMVTAGLWSLSVRFDPPCPPYADRTGLPLHVAPPRTEKQVRVG